MAKLPASVLNRLGNQLRRDYEAIVDARLPDGIRDIFAQLEEAERLHPYDPPLIRKKKPGDDPPQRSDL